MAKIPNELEAGSAYDLIPTDLDSATRFTYAIIEKAKDALKYVLRGKWNNARQDIIQILRTFNKTDINYKHIRQFTEGSGLENHLVAELNRIYNDYGHLYGDYQKIKRKKGKVFLYPKFRADIVTLLRDIISQDELLEKVFAALSKEVKKSEGIYYLAANGGGTHVIAAVTNHKGEFLGFGESGATNWDMVGFYKAFHNVMTACKQAIERAGLNPKIIHIERMAVSINVGSKVGHMRYAQLFGQYIREGSPNIKDVIVLRDSLVAWYTGLGGAPGIVVNGGTGAMIYGYNEGKESSHLKHREKVGGLSVKYLGGRFLSYHAARILLKLYLRGERDTRKSIMWRLVEDAYNRRKIFKNSPSLIKALKDIDRSHVIVRDFGSLTFAETGSLGKYVVDAAEAGDDEAIKLIKMSTITNCYLIAEVANDIGLHNKPFKVTYAGSIMYRPFILRRLRGELGFFEPYAEVINPVGGDELRGLITIAMNNTHFY